MEITRETKHEHALLELIVDTLSKFPLPGQDTDNAAAMSVNSYWREFG